MALSAFNSDENLFEDFDEAELNDIFNLTNLTQDVKQEVHETKDKEDTESESGSETVYIEPMDEEEELLSNSSQAFTVLRMDERPQEIQNGRSSTGSHDYSRRSSIDSNAEPGPAPEIDSQETFRDDELEYTSFEEDEDDMAMAMSQEEVATQIYYPDDIETTEVQDGTNYGDTEISVKISENDKKVEETLPKVNNKEPEEPKTDTQDTDTSFGVKDILNSTVDTNTEQEPTPDDDCDSQKTIILSSLDIDMVNNLAATQVYVPDVPKTITDPVPSTSKENVDINTFELPMELSETRTISEDHDYLAKKLPMNFNLVVEDTEKLVQKNIDRVVSLAECLKATEDKVKFKENIMSLINHISLLQDITQIDDDKTSNINPEQIESLNESLAPETMVKEEFLLNENTEDMQNFVVKNIEKEMSSLPSLIPDDNEAMEVDVSINDESIAENVSKPADETLAEDSLLIDPIRVDIEHFETFTKDLEAKVSQWRLTKECSLSKIQEVLKEKDAEWRKFMLKFECPRDTADVETEIDPKMFAKQNQRAKKDILAYLNDSDSETEDKDVLSSDNEIRQNINSIVEASYSDIESELEEEIGIKRIVKPSEKLPEKTITSAKDSNDSSSESDSDASIDRLCNLANLGRRVRDTDKKYQNVAASSKKPIKKGLNIEELVNGAQDDGGDESEEELLPLPKAPATEAEFLKKINEEYKRQLLESSDSDISDDESAISVNSEAHDTESDDSDSSIIMDRFLSSLDQTQKNAIKSENKPPSLDSGLDEKSPQPTTKSTTRRRSSDLDGKKDGGTDKEDDDDALDLSMFKTATQNIKENVELAELEDGLEPDSTENKVPNVEDYISLSSDSEAESETTAPTRSRNTRKIMSEAELAEETKEAQDAEHERIKRLDRMDKNLTQILSQRQSEEDDLILDFDKKNDQAIAVHPEIVRKLKPHQKEGVAFMYKNCYGPIDDIEKYAGSGCILAHCMGLGKTLQLIALLHTIIRYPRLKTNKILILCPKSTIMNWYEEFERWISKIKGTRKMKVFCFDEKFNHREKIKILAEWHSCGAVKKQNSPDTWLGKPSNNQAGCLLLGYDAFRNLVNYNPHRKNARPIDEKEAKIILETIERCLVDPGADLMVCDEGHSIKNRQTGISKAVSLIKTKRRIILTGTPIQNNLNEYYCMVNWIKPSFLGTLKEFNNRYANPIKQGQHKDSDDREIRQMKKRSYILHKKLQPFVERKEFTILKDELPKKHEYVVYVPLTEVQTKLYKIYLAKLKSDLGEHEKIKGNRLLPDYTYLRKIWTHPRVLESAYESNRTSKSKKDIKNLEKNLDKLLERCDEDDLPDDIFDIAGNKGGVQDKWWERFITKQDLDTLKSSYKLQIMMEILRQCHEKGDKCLIFSNFVAVLSVVEYFLRMQMGYVTGRNYYRLDGSTPQAKRQQMITMFNQPNNTDVKCFLISARAGGQGINLFGANRVIILDTSWNPASDLQSIYRVFRLGQKKTCYVYRLLAMGTMEEKVYSRSVTKQAMSNRVVDEMQVDRHFSYGELAELYTLTEYDMESRPVPILPFDSVLKFLLRSYPQLIYRFHEHDSLLASNDDEELTDMEKAEAWEAYEQEEKEKNNPLASIMQGNQLPQSPFANSYLPNYQNMYGNLGSLSNLNTNMNSNNSMNSMLSHLMFNMDHYNPILSNLINPQQSPTTSSSMFGSSTTNPLMALGNMNPFMPMPQLPGSGLTSPLNSNPFTSNYRSPPTTNPAIFNTSTDDLLTGMRQRNSNTSIPSLSGSSPRNHPINGVARSRSRNTVITPPDVIPPRLPPSADLQRSAIPSPTAQNKRQQQPTSTRTSKQMFEDQYRKHVESQIPMASKRKPDSTKANPSVIEIIDDEAPSSSKTTQKLPQTASKVFKNANIGIHYPQRDENKGTRIYLPDLPEGTSINKIPKASNEVSTSQNKINSATVTPLVNKQMLQRSSTSSQLSGRSSSGRSVEIFSGTPAVQTIGSVSVIPTPKTNKTQNILRTQPNLVAQRVIPSSAASNAPTSVKKAVQQITQNSRGNTIITPVTRPSMTMSQGDLASQGWKRKTPPTMDPLAIKISRISSQPTNRK